jgi:glycosyltransferase involved in cell wall biosynthesis
MRFLFLEPFFGGSHKDFARGWVSHSRHDITLKTLQDRFWKWRMRGAALYWVNQIPDLNHYDGLIVTDLMSLAEFKALTAEKCPPALVYFHESQSSYPLSDESRQDLQCHFTDITTALAADRVVFNSRSHRDRFLKRLPQLIDQMPDHRPHWVSTAIARKAEVLHPGCWFPKKVGFEIQRAEADFEPPLIIWNHRWEHDKNPGAFFQALSTIKRRGIKFRLALLGENYRRIPSAFIQAKTEFADELVQYGPEKEKPDYFKWLQKGTLVVSTAHQENFGISVVEAVRYGCLPLLPNRLSYPELLPDQVKPASIYYSPKDLVRKLTLYLKDPHQTRQFRRTLAEHMTGFAWERRIHDFDSALDALAAG